MPIRLPDVPSLAGSAINAPQASAQAMAAPAVALQGVAQDIAQVSSEFHDIAVRTQVLDNQRRASEFRQQASAGLAALNLELQNDLDPESRRRRTEEFLSTIGVDPDMPPALQDQLGAWTADFTSRARIASAEDAAKLTARRAAAAFDNEFSAAADSGDAAAGETALRTAVAAGIMLPEEAEAKRRELEHKIADNRMISEIQQDAAGWIERNPLETPPAGYDPAAWGRRHDFAEQMVRSQTYEDVDAVSDAIHSGAITNAEQLRAQAGHLRPTVLAKLESILDSKAAATDRAAAQAERERLASPEYQLETAGRVAAMLTTYNPAADDFDADYVEMDGLLRTLPDSAVKSELSRRMDAIRSGKLREIKTNADAAHKALDDAFRMRLEKLPKPENVTTASMVADGFLKDILKLQQLGFSENQAGQITAAAREDAAKAQTLFSTLWKQREAGNINAPADVVEIANAIRLGKPELPWIASDSQAAAEEARREIEAQLGKAKTDLAEWLATNPNATREQIEQRVIGITGEGIRQSLRRSFLEAKPRRGAPATYQPGETSFQLPAKLDGLRTDFIRAGEKYGIDPRFLAAISMHETGSGTSRLFRQQNNAMGVAVGRKGYRSYASPGESVMHMARILASPTGPYRNASSVSQIASIYAPVGAENDPKSLNHHWTSGVSKYLRELGGDPNRIFLR